MKVRGKSYEISCAHSCGTVDSGGEAVQCATKLNPNPILSHVLDVAAGFSRTVN